jgi:hypothetical protein
VPSLFRAAILVDVPETKTVLASQAICCARMNVYGDNSGTICFQAVNARKITVVQINVNASWRLENAILRSAGVGVAGTTTCY